MVCWHAGQHSHCCCGISVAVSFLDSACCQVCLLYWLAIEPLVAIKQGILLTRGILQSLLHKTNLQLKACARKTMFVLLCNRYAILLASVASFGLSLKRFVPSSVALQLSRTTTNMWYGRYLHMEMAGWQGAVSSYKTKSFCMIRIISHRVPKTNKFKLLKQLIRKI